MNDYIFESVIKDVYDLKQQHPQIHTSKLAQLTKDKCNILRYVCGYVMMKIHGKYLKQSSNKAAMFVECLSHLAVEGPESSMIEYTREWIKKVNRGGLFDINDQGYNLFLAIEVTRREKLTQHLEECILSSDSDERKSSIVQFVSTDEDVQFHWSMTSVDIQNDDDQSELLKEIVGLWLNTRIQHIQIMDGELQV